VAWPPTATAQSTLETVKKRARLIAGVKTDFPPFGPSTPRARTWASTWTSAHLFAKSLFNDAQQVELVAVTPATASRFSRSGKIDIIIATVTVTDERRQIVEFSEPYFMSGSLLLVPKDLHAKGLDDMAGKTIAVIQGRFRTRTSSRCSRKPAA